MTLQPQISPDSAASVSARARQKEAIESRTQFQPDAQLTLFTRDTHQGITIRWGTFVLTNRCCAVLGGDDGC